MLWAASCQSRHQVRWAEENEADLHDRDRGAGRHVIDEELANMPDEHLEVLNHLHGVRAVKELQRLCAHGL